MTIFNSLGSNYTFSYVWRALLARNKGSYRLQLIKYLKKKYGGEVLLTYKGREALRLALRIADLPKNYTVGICGFTCYAVYEAIIKEGYRVKYLDIEEEGLNFSFEKFSESVKKYPSMKALIVQNTLGFPCEMEKISKFCKERGIVLIEDLAHSVGSEYFEKKEAGTVGDFTVLSFSQDKMIDGISGGAVVVRNDKFPISNFKFQINKPDGKKQLIDRLYPLFTFLIRKTYGIGVGKLLHVLLKKFDLLSMPMSSLQSDKIFGLPNWYCYLIYRQFIGLEKDLIHRKKIASIYVDGLNDNILSGVLTAQISGGSNLRFPIFSEKREELILFLKKKSIYISDIWYDSPIAPKRFLHITDYNHECPNSEKISSIILNLPTHRNVSEKDARHISGRVNEWLNLRVKS